MGDSEPTKPDTDGCSHKATSHWSCRRELSGFGAIPGWLWLRSCVIEPMPNVRS